MTPDQDHVTDWILVFLSVLLTVTPVIPVHAGGVGTVARSSSPDSTSEFPERATASSPENGDVNSCKQEKPPTSALPLRDQYTLRFHPGMVQDAGSPVTTGLHIVGFLLLLYVFLETVEGAGRLLDVDK